MALGFVGKHHRLGGNRPVEAVRREELFDLLGVLLCARRSDDTEASRTRLRASVDQTEAG